MARVGWVIASDDRRLEHGGHRNGCVKWYSLCTVALEKECEDNEQKHSELAVAEHSEVGGCSDGKEVGDS